MPVVRFLGDEFFSIFVGIHALPSMEFRSKNKCLQTIRNACKYDEKSHEKCSFLPALTRNVEDVDRAKDE
ncbi:hypothetical protein WH47_11307 [Habropoda laboriosa]|uniref:Uncharacterized protein n=1 Tax=Habropoda laboriosa TaxID=597456 RepID=A0A0L7QL23_9HYME|nr:hypothetical protein WH47_11307 [Habropoda laboriosa]